MAFVALYDVKKCELSGRGYRRADTTGDKLFGRPGWVRWPPAASRWPKVCYMGVFKRETDKKPLAMTPLPEPRLLKKGDTIVVQIHNFRDVMRSIKRGRPF